MGELTPDPKKEDQPLSEQEMQEVVDLLDEASDDDDTDAIDMTDVISEDEAPALDLDADDSLAGGETALDADKADEATGADLSLDDADVIELTETVSEAQEATPEWTGDAPAGLDEPAGGTDHMAFFETGAEAEDVLFSGDGEILDFDDADDEAEQYMQDRAFEGPLGEDETADADDEAATGKAPDENYDAEADDQNELIGSLGMALDGETEADPGDAAAESLKEADQAVRLTPAQIEAAVERVLERMLSDRLNQLLVEAVEKTLTSEIARIKAALIEEIGEESDEL